jgi:hypothetical protein
MWGISDPAIWSAYLLCILSSLLCIAYGLLNWNRGQEKVSAEDVQWAKEEKEDIEETF